MWHNVQPSAQHECRLLDVLSFDKWGTLNNRPEPLLSYASDKVAFIQAIGSPPYDHRLLLDQTEGVVLPPEPLSLVVGLDVVGPLCEWSTDEVRAWAVREGFSVPDGMDGKSLASASETSFLAQYFFRDQGPRVMAALKPLKEQKGVIVKRIQLLPLQGAQQLPVEVTLPPQRCYGGWKREVGGPRKLALLVANDEYLFANPLSCSVNDAKAMCERLSNVHHFDYVRGIDNAHYDDIIEELAKLLGLAKAGDTVVFYYSGHGSWFREQGERRSTLVPIDSSHLKEQNRDVSMSVLNAWIAHLNQQGVLNVVLIVDSCCSAGTAKGPHGQIKQIAGDERPIAAQNRPQAPDWAHVCDRKGEQKAWIVRDDISYVLLSAAEELSPAWEAVFTLSLLTALARTQADLTYDLLCNEVCKEVATHGRPQRPGISGTKERQVLLQSFKSPEANHAFASADGIDMFVEQSLALYGISEGAILGCLDVNGKDLGFRYTVHGSVIRAVAPGLPGEGAKFIKSAFLCSERGYVKDPKRKDPMVMQVRAIDAIGSSEILVDQSLLSGVRVGAILGCLDSDGNDLGYRFTVKEGVIHAVSSTLLSGTQLAQIKRAFVAVAAPGVGVGVYLESDQKTKDDLSRYWGEITVGHDRLPMGLIKFTEQNPDLFVKKEGSSWFITRSLHGPRDMAISLPAYDSLLNGQLGPHLAKIGRFECLLKTSNPYSSLKCPGIRMVVLNDDVSRQFHSGTLMTRETITRDSAQNIVSIVPHASITLNGFSRFYFEIDIPPFDTADTLYAQIVLFDADFAIEVPDVIIPLHEHTKDETFLEYPKRGKKPFKVWLHDICRKIPRWTTLEHYEWQFRAFFSREPLSLEQWEQAGIGVGAAMGDEKKHTQDWVVLPFSICIPRNTVFCWQARKCEIQTASGPSFTLDVRSPLIHTLKEQILSLKGIPVDHQQLFLGGMELVDSQWLPDGADSLVLLERASAIN